MNLSRFFDENAPKKGSKNASLQDLRWLETGLVQPGHPQFTPTGEVGKKDNNIKPALEMEWGYGDIAPLFTDPSAGAVLRNLPCDAQADAGPIIFFARDQMNRGVMGKKLVAALRRKFTAKDLFAAKEGLRAQFALEGIVGCIAVDGRGYKSCKVAMEAASHSPFKAFIKHVVGCGCGTPHLLPSGETQMKVAGSNRNSVDEFLASGDNAGGLMVAHCQSTMLPILAAKGDLDESEMDATMIDLMNITKLPETAASEIRQGKDSNLKKVQAAFRELISLRDRREAEKYSGKVDTAGFVVDTEERPVELIEALKREEMVANLAEPKLAELQINSQKGELKTQLVPPSADMPTDTEEFVPQDVDVGQFKSAEMPTTPDKFVPQDVEMGQFMEPEFEKSDEVELDAAPLPGPGEVDVDLRQDMEV
jgi:hypothetical protein